VSDKQPLTYDDLANLYQKHTGKTARIRPIAEVIEWAVVERQDLFETDKDDYIYLRKSK
jgi:hypothetical protein